MNVIFSPHHKKIELHSGTIHKASLYESPLMGRISMMLSEYHPVQDGVDFQALSHEHWGSGYGNHAGSRVLAAIVYNTVPTSIEKSIDPSNHQGGVSYFNRKNYTLIGFDIEQYQTHNPQLLLLKDDQGQWVFSFHLEWRDDAIFQYAESYYQKMHHLSLILNTMLDAYGPTQPDSVLPFLDGLNVFGRCSWDATLEQTIHTVVPTLSSEDWANYIQSTQVPLSEVPLYLGSSI